MNTCIELIKDLFYKLRMMGVTAGGTSIFFGENMSVVNGVSIRESNILNHQVGICYHTGSEVSVAGIWKVVS